MKLAILTIIRNEAHKYLAPLLNAWGNFADEVIAIDDHSTDASQSLLQAAGATWRPSSITGPMWGAEAAKREELWNFGMEQDVDWFIFLDADMIPAIDPRSLMELNIESRPYGISFPLYDLWNLDPTLYRSDNFWQAHINPRMWAVPKPSAAFRAEWNTRGIHCGHLPINLAIAGILTAPLDHAILHYGYACDQDRVEKYKAYMAQQDQLSDFEFEHVQSILDKDPNLEPLDIDVTWPILRSSSGPASDKSKES